MAIESLADKISGINGAFKALPERKTDKGQQFLFWAWSYASKYFLGKVIGSDEYLDKFLKDSDKLYERFKDDEETEWLAFCLVSAAREWVDWKTRIVAGAKDAKPNKMCWKGVTD